MVSLFNNVMIIGVVFYLMCSSEGGGFNFYSLNDCNLCLDIKLGIFGNLGVEFSDGIVLVDGIDVGCFYGIVQNDYDIICIDIYFFYLQYINVQG